MNWKHGKLTEKQVKHLDEYRHCLRSFKYFVCKYCFILANSEDEAAASDGISQVWVPFNLWPEQIKVADRLQTSKLVVILKARQLGMTWLCICFALWLMLFRPIAVILLFSRRDDEACKLKKRLQDVYERLPAFLRAKLIVKNDAHELALNNGSAAMAFPTTAGDSYTGDLALVDEADLTPDLGRLMRAVKPTIDGGGRMILLSRADKTKPQSMFKRIYYAAKAGKNGWTPVFLPWSARPDRTTAWYDEKKQEVLSRTVALDELGEQYPAADTDALAPAAKDKRLPGAWLTRCFREAEPVEADPGVPAIPGLVVYAKPVPGRVYVMGADPAEGNPNSDESSLVVLDAEDGGQVAELTGLIEPGMLAVYLDRIGSWYNQALVMVERNNHGHAVLLWLAMNSGLLRLSGPDGRKGWLTSVQSKIKLYDAAADAFRHGETMIRSLTAFCQLASIEGSTLRAPEGELDDVAMAYVLALSARLIIGRALAATED